MQDDLRCSSCGKRIEAEKSWVRFTCPKCAKSAILRCERCKSQINPYKCNKCGFEGP